MRHRQKRPGWVAAGPLLVAALLLLVLVTSGTRSSSLPVASPAPGETADGTGVEVPAPRGQAELARPSSQPPATCSGSGPALEDCAIVELSSGGSPAAVALLGRSAVMVLDERGLVRLELPGADESWRVELFARRTPARILHTGAALIVTSSAAVTRVDPVSGEVLWQSPLSRPGTAPPTAWLEDGVLQVLDAAGGLTGLDPLDGSTRWSVPDAGSSVLGFTFDGEEPPAVSGVDRRPRSGAGVDVGDALLSGLLPDGVAAAELRWSDAGDELQVVGRAPDGAVRWVTPPVPLPCCEVAGVPAGPGLLVVAAPQDVGAIIEGATGNVLAVPRATGRSLAGAGTETAVWRSESGLVGSRWVDGVERFRATGELLAADPVVVRRGDAVVHVALDPGAGERPPSRPLR